MIKVQELCKSFDNRPVLRGLSFEARDGTITGLLGANGAGKTTTLRMICGVLKPESGAVLIDDVPAASDAQTRGGRLGALLDHMGLYARLTVRENLVYFGKLRGMSGPVLAERVETVITQLGLQAIADRRTAGFSQGERMKTALGRAMLHGPQNLLLDEPTNGLDVPTIRSLRELLKRLRDAGTCIMFSSHVLDEIRMLCDQVVIVAEGRSIAQGSSAELCIATGTESLEEAFVQTHGAGGCMLNPIWIIARKEVLDSLRDVRSVVSTLLYALMGPLVVGMVSMAKAGRQEKVLIGMMSVFILVAAFAGGMNVAMDTVAGERERKSLLALLLNPVRRLDFVMGKWAAVSFFSVVGLALNVLGCVLVFTNAGIQHVSLSLVPALLIGIFPLALLAAALQLAISTACRAMKEAQSYLSMVVFLPMGIGMFLVFFPAAARDWLSVLPLTGQQLQLELILKGEAVPAAHFLGLGCLTSVLTMVILGFAANRLQRDEIIFTN